MERYLHIHGYLISNSREFVYIILLNLIFSLYWVPTKHWAQLQLQVHVASRTHLSQYRTQQRSPPIVFRSHLIPLLYSSNMVSLRVTRQSSVAENTAHTTNFATSMGRLDISKAIFPPDVYLYTITTASVAVSNGTSVSDDMVPPADDQ